MIISANEYKVWLTSDLHFGHQKEFLFSPRGYESNAQMMEDIVERWNKKIAPTDHVYILGDLLVGQDEAQALSMLQKLNGYLHIVLGNHDTDRRKDLYEQFPNIVEIALAMRFRYKKYGFYLSHYPTICSNMDSGKPLHDMVINLCGHSHTKDPFADWDKGLIYHCELDAHDNEPILIDDIIEEIKLKIESEKLTLF